MGFHWAFIFNSLSFVISALCISRLRVKEGGFRPQRAALTESDVARPWHEYREGLRYMRSSPLILGIALLVRRLGDRAAARRRFSSACSASSYFTAEPRASASSGHSRDWVADWRRARLWLGKRLSFRAYRWTIVGCYVVHGGAYVVFSQMQSFGWALFFIALSRAAISISSVLNNNQLLHHVDNDYRGRVFSTIESMLWATMMLSMSAAGIASQHYSPRLIGAGAGILSSMTAIFWAWATITDRLKEPELQVEADMEIHGEPTI